jgi:AcrR family transcriptional regulator
MEINLSRRERKKLDTRQRLLQAARDLFREKGFEQTTVEEITERADVAKGTFFNYFPSKEALLGDLALWGFEKLRQDLEIANGAPASPIARIRLLARLLDSQLGEDLQNIRRAMAARLFQPAPAAPLLRRQLSSLVQDLIKEAQACGEMRPDLDPELTGEVLQMLLIHHLAAFHKQGGPPLAGKFDQIFDFLLDGLAGPKWRNEWHRLEEQSVI